MNATLVSFGIVCVVCAIVGGGLEAAGGWKFPLLESKPRQAGLFTFGLLLLLTGEALENHWLRPPVPRDNPIASRQPAASADKQNNQTAQKGGAAQPSTQSGLPSAADTTGTEKNGPAAQGRGKVEATKKAPPVVASDGEDIKNPDLNKAKAKHGTPEEKRAKDEQACDQNDYAACDRASGYPGELVTLKGDQKLAQCALYFLTKSCEGKFADGCADLAMARLDLAMNAPKDMNEAMRSLGNACYLGSIKGCLSGGSLSEHSDPGRAEGFFPQKL